MHHTLFEPSFVHAHTKTRLLTKTKRQKIMYAALTRGNNERAKTPMIYHKSEVDNTVCCVQVVTDTSANGVNGTPAMPQLKKK